MILRFQLRYSQTAGYAGIEGGLALSQDNSSFPRHQVCGQVRPAPHDATS